MYDKLILMLKRKENIIMGLGIFKGMNYLDFIFSE